MESPPHPDPREAVSRQNRLIHFFLSGPQEQRTKGAVDPRTKLPPDQRTSGPKDQGTKAENYRDDRQLLEHQ